MDLTKDEVIQKLEIIHRIASDFYKEIQDAEKQSKLIFNLLDADGDGTIRED